MGLMPKNSEKGSVLLVLVIFFFITASAAVYLVLKTFTASSKKIEKSAQVLSVALKEDYQNPFDKKAQYENPFSDYHNPFEDLK